MRIGTNSVGNYGPVYKKPEVTNVAKTKADNSVKNTETISNNEKAFFSKLYPQNKEQIMNHHFYMKNGNMSGVMVGEIFDRRG